MPVPRRPPTNYSASSYGNSESTSPPSYHTATEDMNHQATSNSGPSHNRDTRPLHSSYVRPNYGSVNLEARNTIIHQTFHPPSSILRLANIFFLFTLIGLLFLNVLSFYSLQLASDTLLSDLSTIRQTRQAWAYERAQHELERDTWRREREEWEREREGKRAFWDPPEVDSKCLAFNTRRYRARLWNVPLDGDWHGACMGTPIEVHGKVVPHPPEKCDLAGRGEIYGYWRVDYDEVECQPRWGRTWDQGCIGGGRHVIEAPLWGQQPGDDAREMCRTTPGFLPGIGRDMGSPTTCEDRGPRKGGMVGRWEFADGNCW